MPPLAAIRVFEAAARLEHFSRAAEELGMTQAAVSFQIRQLEERIGQRLFLREKGRVRLTELGQRLLPQVSKALSDLRRAFAEVSAEDEGVLAVSAPVSLGTAWLAARIGRFQARYPDLAVRLSLSDAMVDLAAGEFDVALRIGRGNWPGLQGDFLFRSHVTPLLAPLLLERGGVEDAESLKAVELFSPAHAWWRGWFAAAGAEPPPAAARGGIILDNQSQEAAAAVAGHGAALMTPFLWREELASGRLVAPFATFYYPGSANYLVWPENRRGSRKIARFREWVQSEIARDHDLIPEAAREFLPA